jgi:hypothetical protein
MLWQPGGVEESKFCLFSEVFPVRCVSSISPRFYLRRHAFCFFPLVTIFLTVFLFTSGSWLLRSWLPGELFDAVSEVSVHSQLAQWLGAVTRQSIMAEAVHSPHGIQEAQSVVEFLHIPFTALEWFDWDFFSFFFNFYFILELWDSVFHLF